VAGFNELPIFWTTTQSGYNEGDRTKRYMRNGKRVVEKVPQAGHVGDYTDKRRAPGVRYVKMIDSAGNEVSVVLTNAASHMDPNTAYGNYVKRKARFLGWFGIGECPCALASTGEIHPDAMMTNVRDVQPCTRGTYSGNSLDEMCPHAKAEREARLAANLSNETERDEKMKGKEEKIIELLSQQALSAANKDDKILELLEQLGGVQGAKVKQKRKEDE
jgi:hypothetical protein